MAQWLQMADLYVFFQFSKVQRQKHLLLLCIEQSLISSGHYEETSFLDIQIAMELSGLI